jgi:hypothetical protein
MICLLTKNLVALLLESDPHSCDSLEPAPHIMIRYLPYGSDTLPIHYARQYRYKGIVSQDLHIFWYHSIDLKLLHLIEPFVCFLNFVFVLNFLMFAYQRSELTLYQSGVKRQDIFHWFYIGNY